MKRIEPSDLIDLDAEAAKRGIRLRTDLIYAQPEHPLNGTFKEAIYKPDARLWLFRDLAEITLHAAKAANEKGLVFIVTDGLRTTDAQQRMIDTAIVRANPHWVIDGPKMLLSKPGGGGHPRGMAVDIYLETSAGEVLDMGTPLDYFSTDPEDNPAARDYKGFAGTVYANRTLLENLMLDAAKAYGTGLLPLPSEWWDFRLLPEFFNAYAP
ncbi:MAG: D-Ala-D-Ala dipeptidase, partial [Alphaproteobacteria bacterium]|nr:D-Ala-D-Ala dipeptidase [Alphaproteobacteria bacterium]